MFKNVVKCHIPFPKTEKGIWFQQVMMVLGVYVLSSHSQSLTGTWILIAGSLSCEKVKSFLVGNGNACSFSCSFADPQ